MYVYVWCLHTQLHAGQTLGAINIILIVVVIPALFPFTNRSPLASRVLPAAPCFSFAVPLTPLLPHPTPVLAHRFFHTIAWPERQNI